MPLTTRFAFLVVFGLLALHKADEFCEDTPELAAAVLDGDQVVALGNEIGNTLASQSCGNLCLPDVNNSCAHCFLFELAKQKDCILIDSINTVALVNPSIPNLCCQPKQNIINNPEAPPPGVEFCGVELLVDVGGGTFFNINRSCSADSTSTPTTSPETSEPTSVPTGSPQVTLFSPTKEPTFPTRQPVEAPSSAETIYNPLSTIIVALSLVLWLAFVM